MHNLQYRPPHPTTNRGTTAIIPWLTYRNKTPCVLPPRLGWIAAVESAATAGQLATCIRILDNAIRWDTTKRPAADADILLASATVRSKRLQPNGTSWEFLVEYTSEDGAPEEGPSLQTYVEWLPGHALPLWLVKGYEEKYRRDGVVGVRGRGGAAAAVADVCGMCAAVYIDDKDTLWVGCDSCNKWFHCACVGVSQVRVGLGGCT